MLLGRRGASGVCLMSVLATVPVTLAVLGGQVPVMAEPTMPAGFVLTDTPTGQSPYDLTDFAYLPDGSVLTTGKSGRVTWVSRRGGPTTIASLATDTTGDLGLVGIGVASDYDESGHVYLVRSVPTASPPYRLRLSRFTVRGGSSPDGLAEEKVVLDFPAAAPFHAMTSVVAAPDGTLWVSVGDLHTANSVTLGAFKARNLDEPAGKLLHITPDGAGVRTNPHFNQTHPRSWRSRVYARGFRSPFRFSLDPGTGAPIVGDVGWRAREEIDLVAPGRDYKWPCWEGRTTTPGYTDLRRCDDVVNTPPVWSYHHGSGSNQGNSVTGGVVYTGTSYPSEYRGSYFFGDYTAGKIWAMRFGSTGKLTTPPQDPPFASGIGGPVRFATAPNGDIVFADIFSGALRRLTYSPGNSPPVARATTATDPETRTVTFDGGDSVDHDGEALDYAWEFGDGSGDRGETVTHTYDRGDAFEARLTVTDPLGASGTTAIAVAPGNYSPVLTMTTPGNVRFKVGQVVAVSAEAEDAEDGALPVTWTSAMVHCSEATTCHVHPGPEAAGRTWQAPFTDHPDARLQVTATVQDSAGVRVSRTYLARPRQRRLTLVSDTPARLRILTGGVSATALVTQGATVDVRAAKVAADGVATFAGWADGPDGVQRSVRVGRRDITLKARYLTPIDRRYSRTPALRSLLGAPVSTEVAEDRVRYRRYEHGRLYWSARRGVHALHGRILRQFSRLGGHRGVLGVPVTDVRRTQDGDGRYADFARRGSIYWTADTGAHEVYGPLRRRWLRLGGETGWLGLPTTGVRKVRGGLWSGFENGSIRWFERSGRTVVRRT